jgi:hypothetical protein
MQAPKRTFNKAFLKQRPLISEMDLFKSELTTLSGQLDPTATAEFHKNLVNEFLKKANNQEKRAMRRQDQGHLTKADKKALNQQLDNNSNSIGN